MQTRPIVWGLGVALFWLLLFGAGEIFFSGAHLRDDHQQFRILFQLEGGMPLIKVLRFWVAEDLTTRFRPLLQVVLVLRTWMFGVNFFPQFLINCGAAILTSLLGMRIARQMGFSRSDGLLWIFLTLIGTPTVIWWLMGIPESWAMLMLFFGVTLILDDAMGVSQRWPRLVGFLGIVLATMAKESFVFIVPAVIGLRWMMTPSGGGSFIRRIQRRGIDDSLLLGVALGEINWIMRHLPLDQGAYGVAQLGVSLVTNVGLTALTLFFSGGIGAVILGIALFVWIVGHRREIPNSESGPRWISVGVIAGLIMIPQIFLYAKSGMFERYLIPGRWGMGLVLIGYLGHVRHHYYFPKVSELMRRWIKWGLIGAGLVSIVSAIALVRLQPMVLAILSDQRQLPVHPLWAEKLVGIQVILAGFGIVVMGLGARRLRNEDDLGRVLWIRGVLPVVISFNLMFAFGAARIFSAEGYAVQELGRVWRTVPPTTVIMIDPLLHCEQYYLLKYYFRHLKPGHLTRAAIVLSHRDLSTEERGWRDNLETTFSGEKIQVPKDISGPFSLVMFPGYSGQGPEWVGSQKPIKVINTPAGYTIWIFDDNIGGDNGN